MPEIALLVTCEHAVKAVPEPWRHLFLNAAEILDSHRGWDPGSLALGRRVAAELSAPCFVAQVTRLLLDHNRSPHNRALWSEFSRDLSASEKTRLLESYYQPFREQVGHWLAERREQGERVVHLSVHSFTPILDGEVRDVDVGLLYDSSRPDEAFFAELWKVHLVARCPQLRVRFNVPYRGRSDCHQATYRALYPSHVYMALELEVNQALLGEKGLWEGLQKHLAASLGQTLRETGSDE